MITLPQFVTPPPVGLITSARTTLDDEAGGQWVRGLTYSPESCGGYRAASDVCGDDVSIDHTEDRPAGVDYSPWVLTVEERCSVVGNTDRAPILERLRRQLAAVESYAIARELLTGELTRAEVAAGGVDAPNPYLAQTGVEDLTPGGGPVKAAYGLGLLEDAVRHQLRGQIAYLHVPLVASGKLSNVRADGNMRRTLGDSQVVLDAGYANVAPAVDEDTAPAAATAGTAWLYGTGLVVVRRGDVLDGNRAQVEGLDRRTNQYLESVSRPVAAHFDPCARFAVNITLED